MLADGPAHEEGRAALEAANPNMKDFLNGRDTGVFVVEVTEYEVVEGYSRPVRWDPTSSA